MERLPVEVSQRQPPFEKGHGGNKRRRKVSAVVALRLLYGKYPLAPLLYRGISHAQSTFNIDDIIGLEMIAIVKVNACSNCGLQRPRARIRLELYPVEFPIAADAIECRSNIKVSFPDMSGIETSRSL